MARPAACKGSLPWVVCAACRHCKVTGHGGRCRVAGDKDVGDVSKRRQCLYYEGREHGQEHYH